MAPENLNRFCGWCLLCAVRRILPTKICVLLTVVLGLISNLFAQNHTARLDLEQSTDGLGSWQRVPITAGMLNNGSIDLSAVTNSAFYRMKIAVTLSTPTPTGNMITVQGGTLPLSSELAGQTVATFQIGKYEVTWDEWLEVRAWAVANGYSDLAGVGEGSAGNHPVHSVNWYEMVKWCNARSQKEGLIPVYQISGLVYKTGQSVPTVNGGANGYRLPTEAEWEWAARGGVSSQGYTYSGSNDLNSVAWYWDNSSGAAVGLIHGRGTWPVGQKGANELGIYDMSGNAWEWCWDLSGTSNRRARGGTWNNFMSSCAVANRDWEFSPDGLGQNIGVGFRLARNSAN